MGFLDALLGRSKPVKPDLDQLFALPSAALTLQSAMSYVPTGVGSVCFKAAEGAAFSATQTDVKELLAADGSPPEQQRDDYGFTWLVVRHSPEDVGGLVTELHAVNSSLESAGYGPQLLCSVVGFRDSTGEKPPLGLVYLYKRGAFYPFAPTGKERRDNAVELQVRATVTDDLKIEPDLSRWFPVWGAPGL
jgi:hypothetical protein